MLDDELVEGDVLDEAEVEDDEDLEDDIAPGALDNEEEEMI